MDWSQPIAGIPPLLWVLIVAVLGPTGLLSRMAANRFGAVGAVARWWTERTQRAIDRDVERAKGRMRIDNIAYASLERDIERLGAQLQAQAARHDAQMADMRDKWRAERDELQRIINDLVDDRAAFEAWSEWVAQWASEIVDPPRRFLTFAEYRRNVWPTVTPRSDSVRADGRRHGG